MGWDLISWAHFSTNCHDLFPKTQICKCISILDEWEKATAQKQLRNCPLHSMEDKFTFTEPWKKNSRLGDLTPAHDLRGGLSKTASTFPATFTRNTWAPSDKRAFLSIFGSRGSENGSVPATITFSLCIHNFLARRSTIKHSRCEGNRFVFFVHTLHHGDRYLGWTPKAEIWYEFKLA